MKKINHYFFGEELIHWTDAAYFYGIPTICVTVVALLMFGR